MCIFRCIFNLRDALIEEKWENVAIFSTWLTHHPAHPHLEISARFYQSLLAPQLDCTEKTME